MDMTFKDKDKQKIIDFLNMVAKKASFSSLSVEEIIQFFRLLNYMQTELLPKIDANLMEIEKVHQVDPEKAPKKAPKGSK